MSARNRELFALVPASLLVAAGFAAIFIQQSQQLSDVSLTYGAVFLGVCVAAHIVVRIRLPYADPYLLPLVAVLACFGLVVIYRLDEEKALRQAGWFGFGLLLFTLTIVFLKDFRVLERYRYTIAARRPGAAAAAARARASASRSTARTSASASARSSSSPRSSASSRSSSSSPPTCATRGSCWCRGRGGCWG